MIGELEVPVPLLPAGQAHVDVRFSYDINGILEVEAHCIQSGSTARSLVIRNKRLSSWEIDKRLAELDKLKSPPRDNDENNLLIARGYRLFEEFSGVVQENIKSRVLAFENMLESGQNSARIAMVRAKISEYFDRLDSYSENLLFYGEAQSVDYEQYDEMED